MNLLIALFFIAQMSVIAVTAAPKTVPLEQSQASKTGAGAFAKAKQEPVSVASKKVESPKKEQPVKVTKKTDKNPAADVVTQKTTDVKIAVAPPVSRMERRRKNGNFYESMVNAIKKESAPAESTQLVVKNVDHQINIDSKKHIDEQTKNIRISREFVKLDGISCQVSGPERTTIHCISDLFKQSLMPIAATSGEDQLIAFAFNELVYQDWVQIMQRQKMDPYDNAMVNSYIDGLCRNNGWSEKDLERILAQSGYSLQEGIRELKKMYGINYMYEMKLQSIAIPEEEIVAFYDAHPVYKEPRIKVKKVSIPMNLAKSESELMQQRAVLENEATAWSEPFWLVKNETAEHLLPLFDLQLDVLSEPVRADYGFDIYKVVTAKKQTLVSLKKRYQKIIAQLRQQKAHEMLMGYKKQLFENASIVYFDAPKKSEEATLA